MKTIDQRLSHPLRDAFAALAIATLFAFGGFQAFARAAETPSAAPAFDVNLLRAPVAAPSAYDMDTVYGRLMRRFSPMTHRLPGSENNRRALEAVESELRAAGLRPRRQYFSTIVPDTMDCELVVDGKAVHGVLPLGPSAFATISTGPEPISAPLFYIADGNPEDFAGIPDGKPWMAVMNFGSSNANRAFQQGARAVVFIGDARATQWQASRHFTWAPFAPPRAWIALDTALEAGLTAAHGQPARLKINVTWRDVEAVNLWVEIEGPSNRLFALEHPEAIVLSASLDTFGAVPDHSPEPRLAANAALLADTLTRLARDSNPRSVIGVFFGSQYSAQEAGRYFYYALSKASEGGINKDPLSLRKIWCNDELDFIKAQETQLSDARNFFDPERRAAFTSAERAAYVETVKRLRGMLDAWVNNANFELRGLKLEIGELDSRKTGGAPESDADLRRREDNRREDERLTAEKKAWNDLKRQVTQKQALEPGFVAGRLADPGEPDNVWHFVRLAASVREELFLRRLELETSLRQIDSHQDLADIFRNRQVVGHFGFDFARGDRPWVFNPAGDADAVYSQPHTVGQFVRHLGAIRRICQRVPELMQPAASPYLDSMGGAYEPWALCTPMAPATFAQAAQAQRVAGYSLLTVGEPLDRDRMPTAPPADLSELGPVAARFFAELASAPELSLQSGLTRPNFDTRFINTRHGGTPGGMWFVNYAKGSSEIEGPASGALAALQVTTLHTPLLGHTRFAIGRVNREGYTFIPNVQENYNETKRLAVGFDGYGGIERVSDTVDPSRLFYASGGGIRRPFNPLAYNRVDGSAKFLNARTNAVFKYYRTWNTPGLSVFYGDREAPLKYIGSGLVLVDAANTPSHAKTISAPGFSSDPVDLASMNTVRMGMGDYQRVNDERLASMRAANINDDSIETIYADADQRATQAADARRTDRPATAAAEELFGLALGLRAYTPLRDAANDMVRAVLILMILSIPFGFALERLLCGFTSIYKQIVGFAAFFLATFGLLYLSHPAFALASAPIIIFLAFVIILMSGLVIVIVMGRFRQEIRKLQGLVSKVHSAAKESSTALASVLIGISGMRNRPLKTFLTASTIVLLTFTIMVFSSFSSKLGVTETYLGEGAGHDRIEIHAPTFLGLPRELVTAVETLYSDEYDITRRVTVFNDPLRKTGGQQADFLIMNPVGGPALKLSGLLGLSSREVTANAGRDLANAAPGLPEEEKVPGPPPIWLSRLVADKLSVVPGDNVLVRGRPFRYVGPFVPSALQSANLDESRIAPPDFTATTQANDLDKMGDSETALSNLDASSFVWCEPEAMAVTTTAGAEAIPGHTNFLTLYPKDGVEPDIEAAAREIAGVLQGPVYSQSAKGARGARRFFFTTELQGSGFSDIAVPLLLGGLIIFSSLLGSIVDREREIFTYSALGLSPPDVAALFFAESAVYAVIGGMGGYLLSQGVASLLAAMASWGWLTPPEMNFSSLSSIYTILVVMATVILSTIYPALKAGKSANPGVARQWRMPPPKGDRIRFVFPFTVSEADLTGVLSFIQEHFNNHSDACLGNFAARDVALFKRDRVGNKPVMGIRATLTLAPFDLGVFQRLKLYSQDSDIAGIDEVVIELERVSGAPRVWLRSNRQFIDDLRNQFLLWRSLPIETIELYRNATVQTLDLALRGDPELEDMLSSSSPLPT